MTNLLSCILVYLFGRRYYITIKPNKCRFYPQGLLNSLDEDVLEPCSDLVQLIHGNLPDTALQEPRPLQPPCSWRYRNTKPFCFCLQSPEEGGLATPKVELQHGQGASPTFVRWPWAAAESSEANAPLLRFRYPFFTAWILGQKLFLIVWVPTRVAREYQARWKESLMPRCVLIRAL